MDKTRRKKYKKGQDYRGPGQVNSRAKILELLPLGLGPATGARSFVLLNWKEPWCRRFVSRRCSPLVRPPVAVLEGLEDFQPSRFVSLRRNLRGERASRGSLFLFPLLWQTPLRAPSSSPVLPAEPVSCVNQFPWLLVLLAVSAIGCYFLGISRIRSALHVFNSPQFFSFMIRC